MPAITTATLISADQPVGFVVGFLIVGHARVFRVNGRHRIGARTDPRIETRGRCTSIGL
jgi:hypothetical protein